MKAKILAANAEARSREAELDAMCTDEPADPDGRWHAKDHLAHSAHWRERHAALIDAMRTGGELPPPDGHDVENGEIYLKHRDRPLADIRAYARSTWDRFDAAVEACSEADLMKPHPYRPDRPLWDEAAGTGFYHVGEHLTFVYEELGDERALEATQTWIHDQHLKVAPDDMQRATADYNLGCFYAKRGRVDEALPLLRKGITLRKDLADWAKQDTDLDPVRADPRVGELLEAR